MKDERVVIVVKKGGRFGWIAERMDNNVCVGHSDDGQRLYDDLMEALDPHLAKVVMDYESN